ncbi:MAG: hypothetical protein ABI131_13190 [Nostocoides sp.]
MPLLMRAADRLERGLVGDPVTSAELTELVRIAHALPPASRLVPGPSADFVARLGVHLREEAALRPVPVAAPSPAKRSSARAVAPGPRTPTVLHLGGRGLRAGLAAAVVAVVLLSGLGIASRSAVPGSLLYPVKELLDKAAVGLAGSHYDTGMTYLGQAQEHVSDARKLATSHASAPPINVSLTSAISDVQSAQQEFTTDYARARADRDILAMRDFAAQVLPQLDALRPSTPPAAVATLDRLVDLLRPYSAGPGLPGTLPGGGTTGPGGLPSGGLPGAPTAGPGASSDSGQPGASGSTSGVGLPTTVPGGGIVGANPTSPGISVSLPGVSATVGSSDGGLTLTPTLGPISPTVSLTVSPTLTLPTTLPSLPTDPFAVGDTVKILSSPVLGQVGLQGTVVGVDTVNKRATVSVSVLGGGLKTTLPYGSLLKI